MSKLCVITGATGHIGYALLKELLDSGEQVRILIRKDIPLFDGLDCEKAFGDVTDPKSLEKAFEGADIVYHLAGVIDINTGDENLIWNVNVQGTKNVVEACKKCGVKRLVYASSVDAIPPLPGKQLMRELSHFEPDILDGTYAKTKATATQYVLDSQSDTLDVVVTHPGACCGPYDFKVSSVGEMVRMYMRGKFPVSLAFGIYNFVDVRDVAKGMHSAAEKGRPGECYILTSEAVTVDQLLHILAEKTGIPASKFKLPLWLAQAAAPLMEVYYKAAHKTPLFTRYSLRKLNSNCNFSIEKAERELDYHPMSARESFHDMVDWIAEHENIPLKK